MPATLIDTHAHLDDEQFTDLPAVLERARAAEVRGIVTIGTTAASSETAIALCRRHPELRAAIGIQPNNIAQAGPADWDRVVALVDQPEVAAVGETGLDRHWHYTSFDVQQEYFARHLELARLRNLPVVIHCREAEADVVDMLRREFDQHGPVRGVMHSFTGDQATAEACLSMGLFLSFAGMVTYKNAQALRDVAARVPLERLLVETDSPYLAPVPVRGRRNEPAFVTHTAHLLAGIHQVEFDVFANQTTGNAQALFGLGD